MKPTKFFFFLFFPLKTASRTGVHIDLSCSEEWKIDHIEFVGTQRIRFRFGMCLLHRRSVEYFLASPTNQAPTFHHPYFNPLRVCKADAKISIFFPAKSVR